MKINRLHINGFGAFHDKTMEGFTSGVNVLYGKNEAGKSTLLDFIRFTLFGYPRFKEQRRPPLAGGNHGGKIWLKSSLNKSLIVERAGNGDFKLEWDGQTSSNESQYLQLINNVSDKLYNNIYAISLDELKEISNLDESGMKTRIFSMGIGLSGADLGSFEKKLAEEAKSYFLHRGSTQLLIETTKEIDVKTEKIEALQEKLSRYNQLSEEKKRTAQALESIKKELENLKRKEIELTNYQRSFEHYIYFTEAQRKLDEIGGLTEQPLAIQEDFKKTKGNLELLENQIKEQEAKLHQLEEELQKESLDENLEAHKNSLQALQADYGVFKKSTEEQEQERQHFEQAEQRFDEWVKKMGDLYDDSLLNLSGTFELRQLASQTQQKLQTIERNKENALEKVKTLEQEKKALDKSISALNETIEKNAISSEKEAEKARQKQVSLDTELKKMMQGDRSSSPLFYAAIGLSFLLILIGVMVFNQVLIPAVLLGAIGVGVGIIAFSKLKPTSESGGFSNLQSINQSIAELKNDLQNFNIAHEKRQELAQKQELLIHQIEEEKTHLEQLDKEKLTLKKSWKNNLKEKKISTDLQPENTDAFLSSIEQLQRFRETSSEAKTRVEKAEKIIAAFSGKLKKQFPSLDTHSIVEVDKAIRSLEEKQRLLDNQQRKLEQKEALQKELAQKQREKDSLLEKQKTQFEQVNVKNENDFFRFFEKQADYQKAKEQLEQNRTAIIKNCGATELEKTLQQLSKYDQASLTLELELISETHSTKSEEYDEKNKSLASLKTEIDFILKPDEMFALQNEKESLESRLAALTKEWLATKLALHLLGESKAKLEKENQPDVIKHTKNYFQTITSNAYQDIRIAIGDQQVEVFDNNGHPKSVEALSRGTNEQLLLSLRMGLIEEYEKNSEPLPIVLDDIMVNFDNERAANLAHAMKDFAKNRQVILFTCHEHTKALFKEQKATIIDW